MQDEDAAPKRMTLLYQLYLTTQISRRFMRHALAGTGMSGEEYALLSYLYGNGPRTLTQSARDFGLAVTTVATMIAPLIEAGALERTPHPTDRRARLIGLTAAGQRRLEAAMPAFTAAYRSILATLGANGVEAESIYRALSDLQAGILGTIEHMDANAGRSA